MTVFFFSSRRRHTRFDCDWSSDVCSSDLMAFCGNCGSNIGEDARFCTNCGRAVGQASAAPAPARPLEYSIQGDNLQVARIQLKPGQEIFAEAGKMVYKTANVRWETRMSGGTIGDKIL